MTDTEEQKRDRTLSASSDKSEGDPDIQFKPVVKLPEVQISTNEENETVMLKLRAKLYRFDTSDEDDGPQWKERGTGEVKLLKHNECNRVRIVMRRDKTLKICANHFISPWMELKPSIGSDRAFIYKVAGDFADEQIKPECLAIKFGNVEFANTFKEKFNEAKDIAAKDELFITENGNNGKIKVEICKVEEKTDEVTEKLSDLNVSKEEK